jgi:RimJ/RimL family protein N-acetyltransferase
MRILQTPRLTLRWFGPRDARFVLKLLNDPAWLRNIGQRHVHDAAAAKQWIESRLVANYGRQGFGFWAMERREDQRTIGMCGLIQRDTLPHPDIGYALLPRYRGHGYAREAAQACLAYAREVLGLDEVWGVTSPSNEASAQVLAGIGMEDRGTRNFSGDWGDTRVFAWSAAAAARADDAGQIDALVARFFRAFCNDGDRPPTLPAMPHYFLPTAVITSAAADGRAVTTDVHGFIAPRAELLVKGRLSGFREWEVDARTDIAGPVAQRWLRYAKQGVLDGRPFEGRGTKTMQFVRTPTGWKIAALGWTDDVAAPFEGAAAPGAAAAAPSAPSAPSATPARGARLRVVRGGRPG